MVSSGGSETYLAGMEVGAFMVSWCQDTFLKMDFSTCLASQERYSSICMVLGASGLNIELQGRLLWSLR